MRKLIGLTGAALLVAATFGLSSSAPAFADDGVQVASAQAENTLLMPLEPGVYLNSNGAGYIVYTTPDADQPEGRED